MQKFKLFFVLAFALILTGCSNNNSAEVGVDSESTTETTEENKEHTGAAMTPDVKKEDHTASAATVSLDNGKKWEANPETTEGILKMIDSVKGVLKTGGTNIDGYRALGVTLQKDFNTIFEKCTMTGEAHEQLHNYLLPMVDLVKTFEEKDVAACSKALPELKEHLGNYYVYFE